MTAGKGDLWNFKEALEIFQSDIFDPVVNKKRRVLKKDEAKNTQEIEKIRSSFIDSFSEITNTLDTTGILPDANNKYFQKDTNELFTRKTLLNKIIVATQEKLSNNPLTKTQEFFIAYIRYFLDLEIYWNFEDLFKSKDKNLTQIAKKWKNKYLKNNLNEYFYVASRDRKLIPVENTREFFRSKGWIN